MDDADTDERAAADWGRWLTQVADPLDNDDTDWDLLSSEVRELSDDTDSISLDDDTSALLHRIMGKRGATFSFTNNMAGVLAAAVRNYAVQVGVATDALIKKVKHERIWRMRHELLQKERARL